MSRPALRAIVSAKPWVSIVELPDSAVTDGGLSIDSFIAPWDAVLRVAVGYEIHPIAIVDRDFWAFQLADPTVTYWIEINLSSPAHQRLGERFSSANVPPMQDWADRDFCIRAFVVWPGADWGEPLYDTVRRRWWSRTARLSFRNLEPPDVNRDDVAPTSGSELHAGSGEVGESA